MNRNFGTVTVVDFEFEVADGDLPEPLCMVAYVLNSNLEHVRTIRMWRDELLASTCPPFDIGPDTLFVAYAAWAELQCFMVLKWKFPKYIFDAHTAFLAASNLLLPHDPNEVRKRQRKRLSDACRAYGIQGWEGIEKPTIAEAIGEGRWREYGREAVITYCEEDVRASMLLLHAQCGRPGPHGLPPADTDRVIWWSGYSAKAVGQIQAVGMPVDMMLWDAVQQHKAAVIRYLLRRFDPSWGSENPIYTEDGQWSYQRFESWLASIGVTAWPRLESGALDTDSDAFGLMSHIPGIEKLHALRDSLNVIVKAKLPIGRDGRNRPSLFPFATATGRNAHAKSLFNAHAGMRSFMVFPSNKIGAYLDQRTQEVGVAAVASDDRALMDDYRNGDVYYALAKMCGLTDDPDPKHWKAHNPAVRQRMKALQLGINYGMGVRSLAKGLDRHPLIASEIIERHRRRYPRFWEWRANMVQVAMLDRRIESSCGWPLRISTSPNQRTLYNFPMQSGGADMLRLIAVRLCEAGIIPSMLIHDGVLIEAKDREEVDHAIEIMRVAGTDVCDGFQIDVDVDQMLVGGARYRDKRPVAGLMWDTIMEALEAVGALPKRA